MIISSFQGLCDALLVLGSENISMFGSSMETSFSYVLVWISSFEFAGTIGPAHLLSKITPSRAVNGAFDFIEALFSRLRPKLRWLTAKDIGFKAPSSSRA